MRRVQRFLNNVLNSQIWKFIRCEFLAFYFINQNKISSRSFRQKFKTSQNQQHDCIIKKHNNIFFMFITFSINVSRLSLCMKLLIIVKKIVNHWKCLTNVFIFEMKNNVFDDVLFEFILTNMIVRRHMSSVWCLQIVMLSTTTTLISSLIQINRSKQTTYCFFHVISS